MSETIGKRLRRLRLERGLSQRELAEQGCSYAYISRIEAGARRPSVKALRMLAAKLDVSADYLETGESLPVSRLADMLAGAVRIRLEARIADSDQFGQVDGMEIRPERRDVARVVDLVVGRLLNTIGQAVDVAVADAYDELVDILLERAEAQAAKLRSKR